MQCDKRRVTNKQKNKREANSIAHLHNFMGS